LRVGSSRGLEGIGVDDQVDHLGKLVLRWEFASSKSTASFCDPDSLTLGRESVADIAGGWEG